MNGDRFHVDHPEALIVRDGVAVFIAAGGEPWLFDHESVSQFELPELITEGDSMEDALENVRDALAAVYEIYQETERALPESLMGLRSVR